MKLFHERISDLSLFYDYLTLSSFSGTHSAEFVESPDYSAGVHGGLVFRPLALFVPMTVLLRLLLAPAHSSPRSQRATSTIFTPS